MSLRALVFLALGLALLAALLWLNDVGAVLRAVGGVGWGLAAVAAWHAVPLLADALAWRPLFEQSDRPSLAKSLVNRWVGESVNTLLPAGYVGGELVRIRIAVLHGAGAAQAAAATLVDLTLAVLTQVPFALAGLAVLLVLADDGDTGVVWPLLGGIVVLTGGGALLVVVQRSRPFHRLAALIGRFVGADRWERVAGHAGALDASVEAIHARRTALAASGFWRLASWVLGTGEIWLALRFLGVEASLAEAFMIEALGQAVRTAAFLVPAGLGIQEGALVLLGATIGITPETALALSLVKRVRELALGAPGLLAWQILEGARLRRGS